MKTSLFLAIGLSGALISVSCNNGSPDSVKDANQDNAAKIDSQRTDSQHIADKAAPSGSVSAEKDDAAFLVNSANGGMMEVELGKLAQNNGMNAKVKEFGKMMETDHGKGGDKLKSLAASKNTTLPESLSNDAQSEKDKLQKKTGADFDKAYIDMMVDDHKKDIKEFEKAAKDCVDPDIKAFASGTLPMLRTHLDHAESIQKMLKHS